MSTTTPTGARSVRRPRTLLAAATALGILLAATTAISPASAHDELVSSTPVADAALDPAPTEVSLSYSDNILEVGVEVVEKTVGEAKVAGAGALEESRGGPRRQQLGVVQKVDEVLVGFVHRHGRHGDLERRSIASPGGGRPGLAWK